MENFEEVVKKEWNMKDLKALTSQIKAHESTLNLKRRWLMDLALSPIEQKRLEDILPANDKILPESLLREDDVSYEDMKTCIEKGFGAHNNGNEAHLIQKDVRVSNSHDGFRHIFSLLENMTNKDLCSIAEILTGGITKFEKTRSSMKRTIKELLPKVISDKSDISRAKLEQLLQVVENSKAYCGNNRMVDSNSYEAYNAAAVKVLDGLEDFPSDALKAMHRKLKGVKGYIPSIKPSKSGWVRGKIINTMRRKCMEMLANPSETGGPSEKLAKALGVASLTLKSIMNIPAVMDLRVFSPEIKALQNDIAKAIHFLNDDKKVSLIELRKVEHLLDPNSQLSVRKLRYAVRYLLTEYLFECGDMDKIPDFIVETLDIINRRSQLRSGRKKSSSKVDSSSPQELAKEAMQKELEYVLTISAQAKEVVALGLRIRHEFDQDFGRAYMEDFDGFCTPCISDDDDEEQVQVWDLSQHCEFRYNGSYGDEAESFGETSNPVELDSPASTSERDGGCTSLISPTTSKFELSDVPMEETNIVDKQEEKNIVVIKREETVTVGDREETITVSQQSNYDNLYLDVQEACDVTTMVAYRFVGHALDEFAKIEGLTLYQGDRLYLRSCSSVPEDSQESSNTLSTSKFSRMWEMCASADTDQMHNAAV
ncbi:hypothetical protein ACP275_04G162300 [Erythranthe tilingii]